MLLYELVVRHVTDTETLVHLSRTSRHGRELVQHELADRWWCGKEVDETAVEILRAIPCFGRALQTNRIAPRRLLALIEYYDALTDRFVEDTMVLDFLAWANRYVQKSYVRQLRFFDYRRCCLCKVLLYRRQKRALRLPLKAIRSFIFCSHACVEEFCRVKVLDCSNTRCEHSMPMLQRRRYASNANVRRWRQTQYPQREEIARARMYFDFQWLRRPLATLEGYWYLQQQPDGLYEHFCSLACYAEVCFPFAATNCSTPRRLCAHTTCKAPVLWPNNWFSGRHVFCSTACHLDATRYRIWRERQETRTATTRPVNWRHVSVQLNNVLLAFYTFRLCSGRRRDTAPCRQ